MNDFTKPLIAEFWVFIEAVTDLVEAIVNLALALSVIAGKVGAGIVAIVSPLVNLLGGGM